METNQRQLPAKFIFEGQLQHILLLLILVSGTIYLTKPVLGDGYWLGISDRNWLYAVITLSILHQVSGWFVFRFQLVYALFSRWFGKHDLLAWGILFFPMLVLRLLLTLAVGIADFGSMENFRSLQILLAGVLTIPFGYTVWSIGRYLGVKRALGGDHFRELYCEMPLVKEGAFRYSANAIYAAGFLIFWIIALVTGSWVAMAAALFQHVYIWVHMIYTEAPDMRIIYGKSE